MQVSFREFLQGILRYAFAAWMGVKWVLMGLSFWTAPQTPHSGTDCKWPLEQTDLGFVFMGRSKCKIYSDCLRHGHILVFLVLPNTIKLMDFNKNRI